MHQVVKFYNGHGTAEQWTCLRQVAEVAIPRWLFAAILARIWRLAILRPRAPAPR